VDFNFRNKEQTTGAKSGELGSWEMKVISYFAKNSQMGSDVSRCVVMVQYPCLLSPPLRPLSSLCLPKMLASISENSQ
jgi:hypothetical protein